MSAVDEYELPMHEQVNLVVGARVAEVDRGIAPLIAELWKRDIDTTHSCQCDESGRVAIFFPTATDAEKFLTLCVLKRRPRRDDIYQEIEGRGRVDSDWPWPDSSRWSIKASPWLVAYRKPRNKPIPRDTIVIRVMVKFPVADYRTVLTRVTANKTDGSPEAGAKRFTRYYHHD